MYKLIWNAHRGRKKMCTVNYSLFIKIIKGGIQMKLWKGRKEKTENAKTVGTVTHTHTHTSTF